MTAASPDISAIAMSYAMGYFSKIRTEFSISLGCYIFDIDIVHHGGWVGNDRTNIDVLEITKYFVGPDGNKIETPNDMSFPIARIEKGDYDNCADEYVKRVIGNDLDLYKEAIRRFQGLKAFL